MKKSIIVVFATMVALIIALTSIFAAVSCSTSGDKGPTGDPGPQGEKGPTGDPGTLSGFYTDKKEYTTYETVTMYYSGIEMFSLRIIKYEADDSYYEFTFEIISKIVLSPYAFKSMASLESNFDYSQEQTIYLESDNLLPNIAREAWAGFSLEGDYEKIDFLNLYIHVPGTLFPLATIKIIDKLIYLNPVIKPGDNIIEIS